MQPRQAISRLVLSLSLPLPLFSSPSLCPPCVIFSGRIVFSLWSPTEPSERLTLSCPIHKQDQRQKDSVPVAAYRRREGRRWERNTSSSESSEPASPRKPGDHPLPSHVARRQGEPFWPHSIFQSLHSDSIVVHYFSFMSHPRWTIRPLFYSTNK